jgi:5-methylcytosine-specific restriction endonuclease McrBC regulatory subunit McrC
MNFRSFEHSVFEVEGKPIDFSKHLNFDLFENFLQEHWKNRNFLYFSEDNDDSSQQYLSFKRKNIISANDYIGSIYYEDSTFSIFPKIFSNKKQYYLSEEKAELDNTKFIAKLLSYSDVLKFPFFDYETNFLGDLNLIEFIIYVYSKKLTSLLKNHPYVIYENKFLIENQVKGRISINDYVKSTYSKGNFHQIPFESQVFDRNNTFNQIIKRCLSILMSITKNDSNIDLIQNALYFMGDIDDLPLTYSVCDQINLSKNYLDYSIILSLSKIILKNEAITMDLGIKRGFCFLFKASELFEKSVGKIIHQLFSLDYMVDTQISDDFVGIWFEDNQSKGFEFKTRYDIQIKHGDNTVIIDTKYKESMVGKITPKTINQNDIYQLVTYGLIKPTTNLYIIYPSYKDEDFYSSTSELKVQNSLIKIQFIKLPIIDKNDEEISKFLKDRIKMI